jgi:diguanylate cyclase (GGDEF)-like protein
VPVGSQGGALAAAFERKEKVRFDEGMKIPQSMKLSSPYDRISFLRSRAFVVVPLVVKDRAVGIIGLDNKTSHKPITDSQVSLLGIFANQAAVAVENARLYDQLRQKINELDTKVDQLSILHQIGNSMQRVTSLGEALGFIMRGIREGMGFEEVVVCLVNREEDILQGEIGLGVPEEAAAGLAVPLFEEENMLVMSVAGKRPVTLVHFSGEDLISVIKSPLRKGEYREGMNVTVPESRMAVICVPLVAREEIVGIMAVSRKEDPVVRRNDVEMLMLYANTAGLTVERADLYDTMHKDLENLEITDHVSRLFTYRYGQQRVQEMISRSRETGEPLSLLFMGIDDFKEYNDRCGHETGDHSLSQIGEIVKAGIGGTDFAFRYGGRLIVAVLQGRDEKQAVEIAEGIQKRIRSHRFAGPSGESDQRLSLSIGVMEKRGEDETTSEEDLFKSLLALLHRAEAEGGDRILSS